jgi:plastocyanin
MRAAAAGVCAVLLAALALAPGMGLPAHASRAEAADCVWSRHAKRVVKHVRRHGRAHRIVRTRRWWSCDAAPAAPVANLAPAPQAPAAAPKSEPEANRVGVGAHDQAGDFGYVLTRPQVRAGKVTVELNNQGEDPHNLNLQRQGEGGEPVFQLANTLPAQQEVASFELPAGTYRLWCSLPEHDEKGMHTTLIVE